MKAIAWTRYGGPEVLELKSFPKPKPKRNEVLVKVQASVVTSGDCRMRGLRVPPGFRLPLRLAFGLFKPRKEIPGIDFSGEIEAVGDDVTSFKAGDIVFGSTGVDLGANAEYLCIAEKSAIVHRTENLTHEEAVALVFGGLTSLHFLRDKAKLKKDQKILINGASGSVGCAAIQLSRHLGTAVTAVCSASNFGLVQSLGAQEVIDYTQNDFTQNGQNYDVILDTVGNLSLKHCKNSLTEDGKLILISAGLLSILLSLFQKQVIAGVAGEDKESLNELLALAKSGEMKAVIDRVYSLADTAEAHAYVDTGRKKGNVVITVPH